MTDPVARCPTCDSALADPKSGWSITAPECADPWHHLAEHPPATHLHGFLRTYIDFTGTWPQAMVDGAESSGGLHRQRVAEWYEWTKDNEQQVTGHRCTGWCAFVAIAEVDALRQAAYP